MTSFIGIEEKDFVDTVLGSDLPVIVEFGAEWCVPCKRIEPILTDLVEKEWAGRVKLVKLDVDECVNLTMQYQVMGVPTIFLFVKGEGIERLTGAQSRKRFIEKFSAHI